MLFYSQESLGEEVLRMSTEEIVSRTRLLDNEVKIMKSEVMRISHELQAQKEKIKENTEKIKVNKTLPYLVSNVIELLDVDPQDLGEEDGANVDLDSQRKGKCAVIKTSTRQVSQFSVLDEGIGNFNLYLFFRHIFFQSLGWLTQKNSNLGIWLV